MARPLKKGLDYFPFDVGFFEDEKIEAISGEFGIKGEVTTIKLLCAIYQNGYFIVWNDLSKMKILKRLPGVNVELLDAIVNRLVRWEFFDKTLLDSQNVLTSKGIQERYLEATGRRKIREPLLYVSSNSVNVNINYDSKCINVDNNTQSKVKESKVNIPPTAREGKIEIFPELEKNAIRVNIHAKNSAVPHEKIPEELKKFTKWHLEQQTEFDDENHVLNSWNLWCMKFNEKKRKEVKVNVSETTRATRHYPKENYF